MIPRERRAALLTYGTLALACAVSVWPIVASHSVPAFQQDWAWPLARPLAFEWFKTFVGLWDGRSTAHANLLPWQTYAVAAQFVLVALCGVANGLALWIALIEFLAAAGCVAMLAGFGVTSWPARFTAAFFYAFGPVVFTRIAAGHLAYLLGYALLPLIVALGRRVVERPGAMRAVLLGVCLGVAASQIQFLAIAWFAIAPLPFVTERAPGWGRRLCAAAGISIAVQLQALLPLAFGSAAAIYASQPALLSFEYNNSAPAGLAPVMLGYFTHYYETYAPAGAVLALYVLLAVAVALALFAGRRSGGAAIALIVTGAVLTAGLYGPLSPVLAWAFERISYAAAFRDLHYFAAITAIGIAIAVGAGLQRLPPAFAFGVLALIAVSAAPALSGTELRALIVPPVYVADALADMRIAASNGPGRVLWLPAEEPLGLTGAANDGRDFTAYGPASNPSVSDDYQNPQLAYALATLRMGSPDWNAFAQLNVRYFVFRRYVRSRGWGSFGISVPMAFVGLGDEQLERAAARAGVLRLLRRTALASVYELPRNNGFTYAAGAGESPLRYSELRPFEVAIEPPQPQIQLRASRESPDPRRGWVSGKLGWRYAAWLPDSIYPFVWTTSHVPLAFRTPPGSCVLAGAQPRGGRLRQDDATVAVRGSWKRYALDGRAPVVAFLPHAGDVSAIAGRACDRTAHAPPQPVFVFAAGYDAGWRALDGARWVSPRLANGWMMAWDAGSGAHRLVYVPALLQFAGVLTMLAVLGASIALARRTDASRAPTPPPEA